MILYQYNVIILLLGGNMKNIYVDTCESLWLSKIFEKDIVSLEDILDKFEELAVNNDILQEELDDLKQDLQDNYVPVPPELRKEDL